MIRVSASSSRFRTIPWPPRRGVLIGLGWAGVVITATVSLLVAALITAIAPGSAISLNPTSVLTPAVIRQEVRTLTVSNDLGVVPTSLIWNPLSHPHSTYTSIVQGYLQQSGTSRDYLTQHADPMRSGTLIAGWLTNGSSRMSLGKFQVQEGTTNHVSLQRGLTQMTSAWLASHPASHVDVLVQPLSETGAHVWWSTAWSQANALSNKAFIPDMIMPLMYSYNGDTLHRPAYLILWWVPKTGGRHAHSS